MSRTITEILKDADATNDFQSLIDLWNEIANNKRQYSLTEIWFANERIRELALKSNGQDIDKGKFYLELSTQLRNALSVVRSQNLSPSTSTTHAKTAK
jgi:hypothetical protein